MRIIPKFLRETAAEFFYNMKGGDTVRYVGIDIGGTKCAVVFGTETGEVQEKISFATTNKEETLQQIFAVIKKQRGFASIGVSCGGPLDEKNGIILSPPNLPGWDQVAIKNMLEGAFGVPAGLRNDANACAMAEWRFGAGKGTQNMVFLTFGTGLGAGIICNGRLYSGANGFAGELGHIRLDSFGPAGYGKMGSFEGFCSGGGLAELGKMLAREAMQRGENPFCCRDGLEKITAASLARAAREGDSCAKKAFALCGRQLGTGLAIVIDLLNPELIIIGSVFARCRDLLEEEMQRVLRREALPQALEVCRITVPALGENIGDAAALAVAAEVYDEKNR